MLQHAEQSWRSHLALVLQVVTAAGPGVLLYLSFQPRPLVVAGPVGFADRGGACAQG